MLAMFLVSSPSPILSEPGRLMGSDSSCPVISSSPVLPIPSEAASQPILRSAIKIQFETQDDLPKPPSKAVHFDGVPDYRYIEADSDFSGSEQCSEWVGKKSSIYYSLSDQAECPSDLHNNTIRHGVQPQKPGIPFDQIPSNPELRVRDPSPSSSSSSSGDSDSASPRSRGSTGRTSFRSSTPGSSQRPQLWRRSSTQIIRSPKRRRYHRACKNVDEALKKFPVQEAPPPHGFSLVTIENVAAIKVHFETFYNERLCEPDSDRMIRQHRLQKGLDRALLTVAEKNELLRQWQKAESNHLRQVRILKSTSTTRHDSSDVSTAGFQEIRAIGKGSFGLVKLVTDTNEHLLGRDDPLPDLSGGPSLSTAVTLRNADLPGPRVLRNLYAMKIVRKSTMLRTAQEARLRAERDLLVRAEGSQWIVPLIASFQDKSNLYMVMEYEVGGDFLAHLLRRDVLYEEESRFYVAEMILGIEEVHRMGWIHRDLKPDNFLISCSGHLKICDFGLAFSDHWRHNIHYYKGLRTCLLDDCSTSLSGDVEDMQATATGHKRNEGRTTKRAQQATRDTNRVRDMKELLTLRDRIGRRKLAQSTVGTLQYMAPEVVQGQNYDGRCDWWSVGCILFEVCAILDFAGTNSLTS